MCSCTKPSRQPRATRSTPVTVITRNIPAVVVPAASPQTSNTVIQTMDPERLRIEQLRREAIRRSFGSTT